MVSRSLQQQVGVNTPNPPAGTNHLTPSLFFFSGIRTTIPIHLRTQSFSPLSGVRLARDPFICRSRISMRLGGGWGLSPTTHPYQGGAPKKKTIKITCTVCGICKFSQTPPPPTPPAALLASLPRSLGNLGARGIGIYANHPLRKEHTHTHTHTQREGETYANTALPSQKVGGQVIRSRQTAGFRGADEAVWRHTLEVGEDGSDVIIGPT